MPYVQHISSHDLSWKQLAQKALQFVNNQRIAPISFTTVFCHQNNDGLINVYYNEKGTSKSPVNFKIVKTQKSWKDHHIQVLGEMNALNGIAINDLEVNKNHEHCLTIIWYYS